jgi:hypothetical protein
MARASVPAGKHASASPASDDARRRDAGHPRRGADRPWTIGVEDCVLQYPVRLRVETPPTALSATVLAENRFRATRDGVSAELVEAGARRVSAADRVSRLLDDCVAIADDLGCRRELEHIATLLARPGYARQRAAAGPGQDL